MARRFFGRQRRYPRAATRATAVTKRRARALVRKAGPMDRRFWVFSSLTDTGTPGPTTYATASLTQSINPFHIFSAADYQDEGSNMERIKVTKFKMDFTWRVNQAGTGATYGFHRRAVIMLAAGRQIDILEWLDTNQANPIGSLSQLIEYQELTRSVRILAAKRVSLFHHPNASNTSATERALFGDHYRRAVKNFTLTVRKPFWLREPEQVTMVVFSYVTGLLAGTSTDVTTVNGSHRAMVTHYRY